MASLTRKPKSKFWIACFTDGSGKQRQRSTKTVNRTKAMKIAEQWEDAYSRHLTEAQARKVMADIFEEIHGERLLSSSVDKYCEQWLERKEIETGARTIERYKGVVNSFVAYLGDTAKQDLAYLTQRHFAEYRDHVARTLSATSANNQLKILRSVMQDGLRDGLILTNPAALVKTIKKSPQGTDGRRAFTLEEIKKMLAVAGDEWRGMILAGLYTGQRLGDLARLTWANIDLKEKEIALNTGKTRRRIVLPLASPFENLLLSLPTPDAPTAPVFRNAFDVVSRQGKVSTLSRQFNELLASAGLIPKRTHEAKEDGNGRTGKRQSGLSFHCLRHTATSLLKNAGVSDVVARDIIGHDTEAISRVYTHIETKTKREALERLPSMEDLT